MALAAPGERFGKLLTVQFLGLRGTHQVWRCRCDCGTERDALYTYLKQMRTTHCGMCGERSRVPRRIPFRPADLSRVAFTGGAFDHSASDAARTASARCVAALFARYQRNARKRHIEFALRFEVFQRIIFSDCFYCGEPLSMVFRRYGRELPYNSVDRRDSSVGYIEGNCESACRFCNFAKGTQKETDYRNWLSRVAMRLSQSGDPWAT